MARCTFGLLRERYGHPQVRAFYDMAPATGQAAREWDGMISFLRRDITVDPDPDRDDAAKRPYLYPRAMPDTAHHPQQARTLSLWRDLASVYAYAYHGIHGEALRQRKEWFVRPACVAWWVADEAEPTWEEAVERLDHLHEHGPTPHAFTFRVPFEAVGQPTALQPTVPARP